MSQPTMVYKCPGKHKIHGGKFDYKIVDAELPEGGEGDTELEEALADGWYRTTTEAKEGVPSDDEAPTREELEAKATELGIEFTEGTRDKTLAKKIAEALEA